MLTVAGEGGQKAKAEGSAEDSGKRVRVDEQGDLREQIRVLATKLDRVMGEVGEGEHRQTAWAAMMQHTQELERRIGTLEVNVYRSYELPLELDYVKEAKKMQDRWREACRKAKGTQARVGSIKNYTFAGLMIAYTMDPREEEEKKKAAANLMLREMGDENGQLDMSKAH